MRKQLLFIFNPKAGRGEIKNALFSIINVFSQAGYVVTLCPTQEAGQVGELIRTELLDKDRLVISGGDGTLNEAVTALMQWNPSLPFGYIPAGTVNDFAASMNLSKNKQRAAEMIVSGKPFAFDVGQIGDRYFAYVAAFGAFSEVSYTTPQQYKNIFGRAAYFLEGISRLGKIKSYPLQVEYPEGVIEDEFIFGMVTNSVSVGGFSFSKRANIALNDGLFEVCLIKIPKNPIELQSIINALLWQKPDPALMYTFKASWLRIRSEAEMDWTLDGEFGGNTTDTILKNNKEALKILIPEENPTKQIEEPDKQRPELTEPQIESAHPESE